MRTERALRVERPEHEVVYVRKGPLHRVWWKRYFIALLVVALVAIAGGTTFVLTQRNTTTVVGIEDALGRLDAQRSADDEPVAGAAPVADRQASSQREVVGSVATPKMTKETAPASKPSVVGSYTRPAEGVYSYRTTGGERVSTFGAKHDYPSRTYATVRHLDGCRWEHRNDVIEEHVDIRTMCSRSPELQQLSQERQVEFFGQRDGGKNVCEPPAVQHAVGERSGATNTAVCTSAQGDTAKMVRTYIDTQKIAIGRVSVPAIHIRTDATFTGKYEGTSTDLMWFAPETGLVYRWDRTVETMAKAYGTTVRYREDASFVLESLTPQR